MIFVTLSSGLMRYEVRATRGRLSASLAYTGPAASVVGPFFSNRVAFAARLGRVLGHHIERAGATVGPRDREASGRALTGRSGRSTAARAGAVSGARP